VKAWDEFPCHMLDNFIAANKFSENIEKLEQLGTTAKNQNYTHK
jgi:hypothetical protein